MVSSLKQVTNEERAKNNMDLSSEATRTRTKTKHQTIHTKEIPKPKISIPNSKLQQKWEERNLKNQET